MVAAGLRGNARGVSVSIWRARMRLEFALVFRSSLDGLFALALSSVLPASSATSTYALSPQSKAELRKTSFSFSHSVPWLRQPPVSADAGARNKSFFVTTGSRLSSRHPIFETRSSFGSPSGFWALDGPLTSVIGRVGISVELIEQFHNFVELTSSDYEFGIKRLGNWNPNQGRPFSALPSVTKIWLPLLPEY